MLDGVIANCAEAQGILHRTMKLISIKGIQKPQNLYVLPLSRLPHAALQEAAQGGKFTRKVPASQWRSLIQSTDLLLQQRQIVDRIKDQVLPVVGT